MTVSSIATEELISVRQAAALVGVTPRTIFAWLAADAIPTPVRVGSGPRGTVRFRRDDIMAWIKAGCPRNKSEQK